MATSEELRILKLPLPGTRTEYLDVAVTDTFTQDQKLEMLFKHSDTRAVDISAPLGTSRRLGVKIMSSKKSIALQKVERLLFHSGVRLLVQ